MGQSRSKHENMTDVLPDYVLVTIFSFLTLYEKFVSQRVCQRWHVLMREKRVWQCIDFWDKGPVKNQSEPWMFPANEAHILDFLNARSGTMLKQIHLRFVSADILTFLQQNCPNIRVFSFLPRNSNSLDELYSYNTLLCDQRICRNFTDLFLIPLKVVECRMNFLANYNFERLFRRYRQSMSMSLLDYSEDETANDILRRLSTCSRLRYLALHSFNLQLPGTIILTESLPDLQELCLVDVKIDALREREIFTTIVTNLKLLKIFKFSGYGNIDFILDAIVAWSSLRELWLGRLEFTEEAFIHMSSKMPQLQILGLDSVISDVILCAISQHQINLTDLSLVGGEYTDDGLDCLRRHSNLRNLFISDYHIERGPSFSLDTVHRVVSSLPSIECVRVSCQRLKRRHSHDTLPTINKPNLRIHVDYNY